MSNDEEEDNDLGYVPMLTFELMYNTSDTRSLFLKGDALVGPVGREENIFAEILYEVLDDFIQLKDGYRIIEGAADVNQVYNFAYFHFADFGLVLTLKFLISFFTQK